MTTVETNSQSVTDLDHDWEALLLLDEAARERRMSAIFCHLAMADEAERLNRLSSMALAEYAFSDADLRNFTATRLSSWLTLHHEDAVIVASAYDSVISGMPSSVIGRRAAIVQSCLSDFDERSREALQELISEQVWNSNAKAPAGLQSHSVETSETPIWPYTDELR